jgi:hypothetical protein
MESRACARCKVGKILEEDDGSKEVTMSQSVISLNAFLAVALFAAAPVVANGNELRVETVNAWDAYIRSADLRMKTRLEGKTSFLWTDESTERRHRVRKGEILVAPVLSHGTRRVANGLIHHWIGGIFISEASIETLSAVMLNYGAYKHFYKPVVVDSKILGCTPAGQKFWMVWQHKVLFITAAMEGEYETRHIKLDSRRGYNVADSVQLQEIENYGHSGQRLLPPGTGNGYIWRLHTIARYEERDGGVNLELEAVALTRDIPASVRWFVTPIVNHLSMNSLITTLQQTRDAVNSMPVNTDSVSMCSN